METNKHVKVYILGAGCSISNGYPLAKNFLLELEKFGSSLNEQATKIKKCVENTVTLMQQKGISTIDDLTSRIRDGHFDIDSSHGSVADNQRRDVRVKDAKIATVAMLLARESEAKKIGLQNYYNLVRELFPDGINWEEKLRRSNFHVLTFNYDRLFELAFVDLAAPSLRQKYGLYSEGLLNSGFNPFKSNEVGFDESRFSFLKLHGSIGAYVKYETGGVAHYPFDDDGFSVEQITDERFFPPANAQDPIAPWPLIVFPFEKQHVQSGGQHLYYEKYIKAVWGRAKELIAKATEIHIIGYSFQALDKKPLLRLLSNATNCKRGIIQNLPDEAQRIVNMLEIEHHLEVPISWKPYPVAF